MKALLIYVVLFVILSSFSFAKIKYPTEQMINRCFPIGTTYWQAKLNIAQISLDY